MKAWREFVLADPEDCDREYDAYLALVNKMETASGYSPMNSTSSLHHRAPAAAVTAPSTTRSTAPVSAPSGATSSSRDDLSPEARRMYDYIVGNSDELASRDGLSPGARCHYDFLIGSSSAPSSSTAPHATSSAISTTTPAAAVSASTSTCDSRAATKDELTPGARRIYDYIVGVSESCCLDPEPVVATATHKMDFNSVTPSTCSTICLGGNTSVATTPSPARSPTTVSTMLPSPTEIEDIQEAVDFAAVDLTASAPTTCLAECPSHDDDESVSELISSTTKTSSTTIGDVLSELAAPIVADRALDVDAIGYTSSTIAICLSGGSNHSINREDPMHVSPWNVHTVLKVSPRNSPKPPLVPLIVPELFTWSPTCSTDCLCHSIKMSSRLLPDAYMEFNIGPNVSTMAPWPSPSCTRAGTSLIFGHDLCHSVQQKRGEKFSVVRMIPQSWPPSLGLCTNLPTGNFLSSSGSITVNDNNSRHANWCLDDVFWKLPRWWSHTQCVRPTNAILDVSSWMWVRNVSVTHTMELTLVLLATYPTENSNGTIASRKRNDTDGDTAQPVIFSSDSDYLELVLRLIIKLFSWSSHPKWPLMSLNGPFLISTDVQQEFMEMYNVTAVLSRLLVLVVVSTEAMLGTVFQFATGNTIILLPWDPGLLLPGMDTMFSTLVDGLAIRLISSREITCLKGIPMHELFSCSLVVELIKKGMGAIEELQPWTFWEGPLLVTTVYHNPPPAKPPDKSNYT